MSNSRNRRNTLGAFGKAKARVIRRTTAGASRQDKSAEAPQAPGGFNISQALVDFAAPITEQAGNNHTALRGAMNVAILLWNAFIEGEAQVQAAREKLEKLPGATPAQIADLVTSMAARKQEMFPDVKQLITKYDIDFRRRGTRIFIKSINLNPPGVEKTDIASQLGGLG